jgi:hypothetical protein
MHSPTPAASIQHAASLVGRENDERRMWHAIQTISSFQYFAVISLHVTADVIPTCRSESFRSFAPLPDSQTAIVFVYPPVRLSGQASAV